ncbi:DNA polymerase ligase N-terminal domain-containing protein [Dehalogenimonas alkenigignens]|uniref:DNA ligase D, 3'-phosphoesterase domain n=1 Tax=Dehalogenimonas alkenigignens TaxID=1217799 RepID=A0A0W0GJI0_9CHLR|nr:DNA polymerase ligase N-terminal domain-containing protein [Dehalogenimonas alkenigignens]KTB48702.1 DNA ligase D, 3'-phosphoesterase domain [Dehalogenimonas alkenigignens]PVV84880.1 DNA ligase [Dehalogenimonas alkenigignens]
MKNQDKLSEYRAKRDFQKTAEPPPETAAPSEKPVFVVQKHAASRLHYDLRLEIDGVLKSWAVPKGPSMDPEVKHLAVPTEDHPMAYGGFEGTIPEGEYGAGTVMVWDTGTYRNIKAEKPRPESMAESFDEGRIEVFLEGKKLAGRFALIKTARGWLFFKMKDEYARAGDITAEAPDSAISGRNLEQITAGR